MKSIRTRLAAAAAVVAAVGMLVSGCSGASSSASGVVTVNGSEPQNPLIPANTNETGGGKIVGLIYSGLVYYDKDGKAHNDMAESISSSDKKVWTVKVRKDAKYSDGSPVTAKDFVDTWNYAADPVNGQINASFFAPIEGYQAPPADAKTKPVSHPKMSGLKLIDDHTFQITLAQPVSDFEQRLGYAVFYPLPPKALKDLDAYGKAPMITNGPYKLANKKAWTHNQKIDLVPNDKYKGPRKAQNKGITIRFYSKTEAAYAELTSGTLDVLDDIPQSSLTTYQKELDGRAVSKPVAAFQAIAIRMDAPGFTGDEGRLRRQAISMAINRKALTDKVFHNTKTPAEEFTSPSLPNYNAVKAQVKGLDVLKFNPTKAKELWKQADAIKPFSGKFTIAYNSDAPHQAWVDAVCHQISNTLGIQAEGKPYPDFKSLRDDITNGKITSAFRSGWQGDYPSMQDFLEPLYSTAAIKGGSNDAHYSNPQLDQVLKQAQSATDDAMSDKLYAQAQSILARDLPAIPLYYMNVVGGWSKNVSNVEFGWDSVPLYWKITKK